MLRFSYHDGDDIPPGVVREYLVKRIGLSVEDARAHLRGEAVRTVRICYHREPEGWWADSPDLEGYAATAATFDRVRDLVYEGVPFFLEDDDVLIREVGGVVGAPSSEGAQATVIVRAGEADVEAQLRDRNVPDRIPA